MQTAKERTKNRNYYLAETKKNYRIYLKYIGDRKSFNTAKIHLNRSYKAYDGYTYNGGTKKYKDIIAK